MDFKLIIYEKANGVATIAMNNPRRRNAFSDAMCAEMKQALRDAESDSDIHALILTGTGDQAFCAGADVSAWGTRYEARSAAEAYADAGRAAVLHNHAETVTVPFYRSHLVTIAAVNGDAAGGGFTLSLCCDMRIVSEKARFASSFVRRGVTGSYGNSFFLSRLVGTARTCELMLTGDIIDAAKAERYGIVNKVVPLAQLMPEARSLAERIAKLPPLAVRATKMNIYHAVNFPPSLEDHLVFEGHYNTYCHQTEDAKEGAKAFMEKREPVFRGR